MAGRKKPIVAVGSSGQVLSYYESTSEAARMNGLYASSIWKALHNGTPHRRVRWVYESEYRQKWMDGRTDDYRFDIGRMRSDSAFARWGKISAQQRETMRDNCRKSRLRYLETHMANTQAAWKKQSKPVLCISTGETFESASSLARHLGVDHSAVTYAIRKGRKVRGLIVSYINKEVYEKQKENQTDNRRNTD